MTRRFTPFDYPIVIKQHLGYITVSVPDLGIAIVENLPAGGRIDSKFLMKIAQHVGNSWVKASQELDRLSISRRPTPRPSSSKEVVNPKKSNSLSTPKAAAILGVSENTVRNLVKGNYLRCKITAGGHRRFSEGEVMRVKELLENGIIKRIPGPKPGSRVGHA